MYVVYNKDHIHNLLNESKTYIFAYICDRMVYIIMSLLSNHWIMLQESMSILTRSKLTWHPKWGATCYFFIYFFVLGAKTATVAKLRGRFCSFFS